MRDPGDETPRAAGTAADHPVPHPPAPEPPDATDGTDRVDEPSTPDQGRPVAEALGLTPASEVARAALNRARAAARARGAHPGRPVPRRDAAARDRRTEGRDPVLIGDTLSRVAAERGWQEELSVGGVLGRWREVVGDQIADHCVPEEFDAGVLRLRADSTAWAANLRLLAPQLLARLAAELGPDVVREVTVLGPAGPQWGRGPRRVRGKGPRDTYG